MNSYIEYGDKRIKLLGSLHPFPDTIAPFVSGTCRVEDEIALKMMENKEVTIHTAYAPNYVDKNKMKGTVKRKIRSIEIRTHEWMGEFINFVITIAQPKKPKRGVIVYGTPFVCNGCKISLEYLGAYEWYCPKCETTYKIR